MTNSNSKVDLDRLLKLRMVVARYGEMDSARWWNTSGLLGTKGALLMSRGFPRTHIFAQAGVVLAVARNRCEEVFQHPGATTIWSLPAELEDQFDSRWGRWLEDIDHWREFFTALETPPPDLLSALRQPRGRPQRPPEVGRGTRGATGAQRCAGRRTNHPFGCRIFVGRARKARHSLRAAWR